MKHKNLIVQILGIFFVIIIASAAVFSFSSQLNQSLIKETYKTLSEVSEHYNSSFLQRLSYDMKTMKVLAGSLAGMTDATKQDIMDILQNAVDDGEFTRMVVSNASGTTYSNTGVSINISEREYFQKAMRGESDVSQPLTSVVEEEEIIIVAVPIQIKGRTIVGVLFGVYPLSIAGNMLLDSSYFSEGYGYIMSPTGNIILSSEHANRLCYEKNLLSFLEKANLKNFTVEEFQSAITKKESRSFTFTYEGKTRFVNFMPSTINDWYTVSVASDLLLVQKEKTTSLIVIQLVLTLIVSGIVLIILIVYNNRRHNKVVTMANERYASLIKNISGGVIVALGSTTIDGTIATYVSEGFTKITGYTLQDIQTLYNGRYLDIMYDADRQPSLNQHNEQIKVNNTYHVTYRLRKKDGSLIWVVDNGYLVQDIDGLFNHSIITDITAMKAQEEELRASDNRFSVAINSSSGTLFEVDMKKQLYTHFENAERIFGVSADKLLEETFSFSTLPYPEFINATTAYFFHPDDRSLSIQNMAKLEIDKKVSYEARIRRYDNSFIWAKIDLSLSVDEYGLPERLIGFMSDIDSVKKQAEQLKIQLQVDPMTGLCNKIAMATLSDKFLKENSTGRHALLAIDIDNFKGINDTLGHAFGDIVIIEISTKLKTLFDDSAILARMGGDEFAILMGNITDKSDVLKKATELSSAFRQTYLGNKDNYKISCSIGIIMIDNSNESFDTLYRKVDAALYQAKRNGKDQFVFYKEEESSKYFIESRHTTDEQLQNLTVSHDIESHIFELMYASKDFDMSINMAIAAIGQLYHVSRVSIFENNADNLSTKNTYEWCNEGVSAEINNLQDVKFSAGADSLIQNFDSNGLLYCNDIRELSPYLRKIMLSKHTLSTLQLTIVNDGKLRGFIGFDECDDYRVWTSEEIEKLAFLAKVLSVFLFKKKAESEVLDNLHTRIKILDILPDYICVVNPETHSIEYTNSKMKELLPSATSGALCFATLRGGQRSPCKTCLIERIKKGDTHNLEIISEDRLTTLSIDAITISWTNNKEMVLLYGSKK